MAAKPAQVKKLTPKNEKTIGEWSEAREELTAKKVDESAKRAEVLKIFYPEGVTHKGVENWAMPENWLLKVEGGYNVRIDETVLQGIEERLKARGVDEKTGEIYTLESVFKWKPTFVEKGYASLPDEVKQIFNDALTFTPASPAIELVQPKTTATPTATAKAGYNPFAGN